MNQKFNLLTFFSFFITSVFCLDVETANLIKNEIKDDILSSKTLRVAGEKATRNLGGISENIYAFNAISSDTKCVFGYKRFDDPVQLSAPVSYGSRLIINDIPDSTEGSFTLEYATCGDVTTQPASIQPLDIYAPYSVLIYTYVDNTGKQIVDQFQSVQSSNNPNDLTLPWVAVVIAIDGTNDVPLEFFVNDVMVQSTRYFDSFRTNPPDSFIDETYKIKLCTTTGNGCLYSFDFKPPASTIAPGETLWFIFTSTEAISLYKDRKIVIEDNSLNSDNAGMSSTMQSSSLLVYVASMIVIVICTLI